MADEDVNEATPTVYTIVDGEMTDDGLWDWMFDDEEKAALAELDDEPDVP